MTSKANKYEVIIFGQTYALVSNESHERIVQSAERLDTLMKDIAEKSRTLDIKNIAILAALQIAHQCGSLENHAERERDIHSKLIAQIDDQLAEHLPS